MEILGRPAGSGPEAELVLAFIEESLPKLCDDECRTVFIEPFVGTARPDIVVVDWIPKIARNWPKERANLKNIDWRMAQLLFVAGALPEAKLASRFPRHFKKSLERLELARIIEYSDGNWRLYPFEQILAIRHIIAFEAKLSAMSRALDQALFNTWFSSESYILTPSKTPAQHIVQRAKKQGIGIWLYPEATPSQPYVSAKNHAQPRSYVSWIFNNRVWETSILGRD